MPTANINLQPFMFSPMANGVNMAMQVPDQIQGLQKNYYTNQLLGAQAQLAPQFAQSQLALQQAQAQREKALASLPFGGAFTSGVPGDITAYMAAKQAGLDPSIQQSLLNAGLMDTAYKYALAQNMMANVPYKNLTAEQKNVLGATQAKNQGSIGSTVLNPDGSVSFTPMTGYATNPAGANTAAAKVPPLLTPGQVSALKGYIAPNGLGMPALGTVSSVNNAASNAANSDQNGSSMASNQLQMAALKSTVPANVMKRIPFGNQLEVTLNNMPLDAITSYTGKDGQIKFMADLAKYKANPQSAPQSMIDYQNFVNTQLPIAAKQATQFWGSSVRPQMVESIENSIYNKSNWLNNPTLALNQFNSYRSLINQENSLLKQQATNPGLYTGETNVPESNPISGQNVGNMAQQVNMTSQLKAPNSFSNKQDFRNYFSSLSAADKQAYAKQYLGAK
jgi:hypothetical protein